MNEGGLLGDRRASLVERSMGSVDHLRRQHRELLHLTKEIVPFFRTDRLANDVTAVRLKLAAFARKLGVHLALEDRFLHERLMRHSDPAVAAKATEHQREAHSLGARVDHCAQEWISIGSAADHAPAKFIDETKEIFELMSKRFELENSDLYPLVDRICSPSGTWPLELLVETNETRRAG
jgi:hemerythrin-like domain-containing protein